MNLSEKIVKKATVFKGHILELDNATVSLPNNKTVMREIVQVQNAVCIAALTPEKDLIFERQFRCPLQRAILELPAGKIEKFDKTPLDAAKRELKEETGITATDYAFLGKFYSSPGFCNEIIYLYSCKSEKTENTQLDEDEFIDIIKIPLSKAINMVLNNEIQDGKTQALILKLNAIINSNNIKVY